MIIGPLLKFHGTRDILLDRARMGLCRSAIQDLLGLFGRRGERRVTVGTDPVGIRVSSEVAHTVLEATTHPRRSMSRAGCPRPVPGSAPEDGGDMTGAGPGQDRVAVG